MTTTIPPRRQITDHKVNGLNEALNVFTTDAPGAGGANHEYVIDLVGGAPNSGGTMTVVRFQKGPVIEAGFNGISNEALLAIVIDRLRGFQHKRVYRGGTNEPDVEVGFDFNSRGEYANRDNAIALTLIEDALMRLQKRTRDRMARGVEGTHKV